MRLAWAAVGALVGAQAQAQTTLAVPDFAIAPVAAGNWVYQSTPGISVASFNHPGGMPQLVVHCVKATRRVTIARAAAGPSATLYLWTSSTAGNLPAQFDQASSRVQVELPAFNALLDAIAFSRGRFAVSIPGAVPLVVPATPEQARVIEDCRI